MKCSADAMEKNAWHQEGATNKKVVCCSHSWTSMGVEKLNLRNSWGFEEELEIWGGAGNLRPIQKSSDLDVAELPSLAAALQSPPTRHLPALSYYFYLLLLLLNQHNIIFIISVLKSSSSTQTVLRDRIPLDYPLLHKQAKNDALLVPQSLVIWD